MDRPYFLDEYIEEFSVSLGNVDKPDSHFQSLESWVDRFGSNRAYGQKPLSSIPKHFLKALDWTRNTKHKDKIDLDVKTLDDRYTEQTISKINEQIANKCWLITDTFSHKGRRYVDYHAYELKGLPAQSGYKTLLTHLGKDYFVGHLTTSSDDPKSEVAAVYVTDDDFKTIKLYSEDPADIYEVAEEVYQPHELHYMEKN